MRSARRIANARRDSRWPTKTMMKPLTMKNSATPKAPPLCMMCSGANTQRSTIAASVTSTPAFAGQTPKKWS